MVIEYTLETLVVLGIGSFLWIFYQEFVQGNLYGSDTPRNIEQYFPELGNDQALGLEQVVSLPFP